MVNTFVSNLFLVMNDVNFGSYADNNVVFNSTKGILIAIMSLLQHEWKILILVTTQVKTYFRSFIFTK